mmetsp:Transcript_210/g.507  ORF Transcript_210/g.507 Transcript_210/m.507 type:complete len:250 (+) Transcript_210:1897-2646(+)
MLAPQVGKSSLDEFLTISLFSSRSSCGQILRGMRQSPFGSLLLPLFFLVVCIIVHRIGIANVSLVLIVVLLQNKMAVLVWFLNNGRYKHVGAMWTTIRIMVLRAGAGRRTNRQRGSPGSNIPHSGGHLLVVILSLVCCGGETGDTQPRPFFHGTKHPPTGWGTVAVATATGGESRIIIQTGLLHCFLLLGFQKDGGFVQKCCIAHNGSSGFTKFHLECLEVFVIYRRMDGGGAGTVGRKEVVEKGETLA